MNFKYHLLWLLFLIAVLFITLISKNINPVVVSEDTIRICREYANRDHEKELAPARWEYLKQFGDPNDHEFFFQSCIGHITGVPATKEYMR